MRQTLAAVSSRTDLRREAGRSREQDFADVRGAQQQLEAADGGGARADASRREHHVHVADLAVLPATEQHKVWLPKRCCFVPFVSDPTDQMD